MLPLAAMKELSMQAWDFVIVGGGMAGTSVAWQLAQSGGANPPSVLVLERESQPGYHTTGRFALSTKQDNTKHKYINLIISK